MKINVGLKALLLTCLILLVSCGNTVRVPEKIETEVSGKVEGDAVIEHRIAFDLSTFREVCEAEYADEENEQAKEQLIADCQAERLQDFLDLLTNLSDQESVEE